jgi:hypothetical protein
VQPVQEKDHGEPVRGPYIFDHVSFGVESEDDLWELKDKLDVAGFEASDVIDHGFIHSIYAFDPNGIPIEFSHNVADIDVRRSPRMADETPAEAAKEGAEPNPDRWPAVTERTPADERTVYPGAGSELFHGVKK